MNNYRCLICGYVYNPENNNNVSFENLEDSYICPICGTGKNKFEKEV